jgi:DNA-binding SARP family transcriptional activator
VPGQPGGPAEVIVPAADAAQLLPGWQRDDISGTGLPGLTVTPTLDAALDQAEALIVRRARMSGSQDTGDDPQDSSPALPAAALIASPSRAATQRLRAVLESGRRTGVAGILLGDWPPGTTCQVAADGTITSTDSAMDGIRLFNLGTADTIAVISLLREACGTPAGEYYPAPVPGGPPPPWPASETAPAPSHAAAGLPPPAHGTQGSGDPPGDIPADAAAAPAGGASPAGPHTAQSPPLPASAAPGPHPDASRPAARPAPEEPRPAGDAGRPQQHGNTPDAPARRIIRVEILGPLRITARGEEIRGGLRKARELLAFLAVHPDGVTGEAISEALWPESAPGRDDSQRNLALRKLRDMLRAAAGLTEPMLVTLTAERYRLDPAFITTDVAGFQAALEAARHAADDTARLAACQEAAALYRGPLADGAGYDWAEPFAEAARRRALDAWTRIAELLEPGGPDQALAALETALGHDPFNEYLYQRIMRLQAAAGRPDAVRRTLRLLETRLTEIGVTPGTQTRQAAAALLGMPGPPPRGGGGPQPPAAPRPAPAARQRPPGHPPAR